MAKLRLLLAATMLGTLLLVPATANAAPPAAAGVNIPISGTVAGVSSFVGSLNLTGVANQGGQLVGTGTLTGTLTNLVTGATSAVDQAITIPLAATGTCDVLHLTLGPLDLNLLGLVVHLDQVKLDITAQQGPGNLLGNLLCAVTGLLDNGGPLNGIVGLLNNLLRQL